MEIAREAGERTLTHRVDELRIAAGRPLPLGATPDDRGINFAVVSGHADSVTLVLFESGEQRPFAELELDPTLNRTGRIWHVFVEGVRPPTRYAYRVQGDPSDEPIDDLPADVASDVATSSRPIPSFPPPTTVGHGIDPHALLLDPYAHAIGGSPEWGGQLVCSGQLVGVDEEYAPRSLVVESTFDWSGEQRSSRSMAETLIYELHVRGYTRHGSSGVTLPGTYTGLTEKIPHLKELGVTAVELMPVHEFNERENSRRHPDTGRPLLNYWGYSSVGYFAPKASYASRSRGGAQVDEFKAMVKSFHDAGIEVILDVVYNHTGEGNGHGPTLSFKGLDNATYYILDPHTREYHNYSGCGNTVNSNHPVVQDLILASLRYWASEMHVDGFRFDLASIFCRGQDGAVLRGPPIIARIAADPMLSGTKLIAEAWDSAGLYQVGDFPHYGRFAEWNGKFRDDVRKFVKGDAGMVEVLASRMLGSPDLYEAAGRPPTDSVNFIAAHDGFTLLDLVSYDHKHNLSNGEDGRDGCDANYSWNCGHEGPSSDPAIVALRLRQMKNFITLLLLSHGTPMMLGGDELGRTQSGNNNPYCHDDETTWVDWGASSMQTELIRYYKALIALRQSTTVFRPSRFSRDERGDLNGVRWHGVRYGHPDWSYESRSLAAEYRDPRGLEHFFFVANAHCDSLSFELPRLDGPRRWWRILDTSLPWPRDISAPGQEAAIFDRTRYRAAARSSVLLVAR